MSIYSGFALRQQEQSYDYALDSLLYILQKRIVKFYKNQPADQDKFKELLVKFYYELVKLEHHKYLQPKFSNSLEQLMLHLGHQQKLKTNQADSNKQDSIIAPVIKNSRTKQITKRVSSYSIPLRPVKNSDSQSKSKKLPDPYKPRKSSLSKIINQYDHSFDDHNIKPSTLALDSNDRKQQKKKRPLSKAKYISKQISSKSLLKKEQVSQIISDYVNKVRQTKQKNFRRSRASMMQAMS